MNNLIKLAVLASLAALPASATWLNISGTNCVCTDFSQLADSSGSSTRWVNDYGSVNDGSSIFPSSGTGSGASQLVGWFANVAASTSSSGIVANGGSTVNSTGITTSTSLPISVNTGTGTGNGLFIARGGSVAPTDEALGMSAGAGQNVAVGVAYQNDSGSVVNTLLVSYRGEQWRNSGSAAQSLEVSYAVFGSSTSITRSISMDPNTAPGSATTLDTGVNWRSAGGLSTFTTPVSGGTAGALDGNAAANSQTLTFNLSNLNLQPGGYVIIRWRDVDNASINDHLLAIDDVCVAIPEPSTYAAIIALGAIGTSVWRSRRRSAKA